LGSCRQHRLSGRVAVAEKPDVVWDRPDLETAPRSDTAAREPLCVPKTSSV